MPLTACPVNGCAPRAPAGIDRAVAARPGADSRAAPRRDFGPHLGDLSALLGNLPGELGDLPRQLSPLPGHLSPQLREAGLELVGCDLVAVLGSLPHRIVMASAWAGVKLGVGERTGDGVRVEHAPLPYYRRRCRTPKGPV